MQTFSIVLYNIIKKWFWKLCILHNFIYQSFVDIPCLILIIIIAWLKNIIFLYNIHNFMPIFMGIIYKNLWFYYYCKPLFTKRNLYYYKFCKEKGKKKKSFFLKKSPYCRSFKESFYFFLHFSISYSLQNMRINYLN